MKVCFPVAKAEGLESKVYGHFGSAPVFVVVETDSNEVSTINNRDQNHVHGACSPLKALNNQKIDVVVVGGIGGGALTKLNQMGIKVFQSGGLTIKENISRLKAASLPELTLQHCCSGHGHGSGCRH